MTTNPLENWYNSVFGDDTNKTFDVWYYTPKRKTIKHKTFTSIEQIKKWCKINKDRVEIQNGSWQVFELMESLQN